MLQKETRNETGLQVSSSQDTQPEDDRPEFPTSILLQPFPHMCVGLPQIQPEPHDLGVDIVQPQDVRRSTRATAGVHTNPFKLPRSVLHD